MVNRVKQEIDRVLAAANAPPFIPLATELTDMSELHLGQRYGSEHMNLQPGSKVAVEINGVLYSDTVVSVRYESAAPEVVRHLSRRQRIIRRLTPKRFRKSLVIRAARPAMTTITTGWVDDGQ